MICAPASTAINIIACLWVGVQRDIRHFAKAGRVGICDTRSLLPGWHLPDLAEAPATGPIMYDTVVPHLLRQVGIVKVDLHRCATHACDVGLRGGIIHRGKCICACVRIVTPGRSKIAACSQNSLSLRCSRLEKDILLLDLAGQACSLFAENPACAHHWYRIA